MTKSPWEWIEVDLMQMKKDKAQESLNLEFKKSNSLEQQEKKKNEISKDVSSFANSAGGTIIYGVAESGSPPSVFDDIDIGIDPAITSPDWLEQIINSRIQPRIREFHINPIELETVRPGKFVYAVSIPSSPDAPHQAYDKKYYKRYNFQSIPMDDYEIQDIRNRHIEPVVIAEVMGKNRQPSEGWDAKGKVGLTLNIVLKNIGHRIAKRVYFECYLPVKYLNQVVMRIEGKLGNIIIENEEYRNFRYHHSDNIKLLPLFPNTECEVLDGNRFFVHLSQIQEDNEDSYMSYIKWQVYADGAKPTSGEVSIGELFRT